MEVCHCSCETARISRTLPKRCIAPLAASPAKGGKGANGNRMCRATKRATHDARSRVTTLVSGHVVRTSSCAVRRAMCFVCHPPSRHLGCIIRYTLELCCICSVFVKSMQASMIHTTLSPSDSYARYPTAVKQARLYLSARRQHKFVTLCHFEAQAAKGNVSIGTARQKPRLSEPRAFLVTRTG